jgi:hypothetical protein
VEGNNIYVRAETPLGEQHSKLDYLAQGPYRVESNDGRTMLLRIGEDSIRVSSDRITKAPSTAVQVSNEDSNEAQLTVPDESDVYVVERSSTIWMHPMGNNSL